MSRTVDERVVSMQFDNKNFEQNARTSMSTLDKLKQKLNLSGAAKGLNEVHAASKKVNFSEMENAAYKSGFHIQDIWLKTASVLEYQVAGKIVNAAKNMLNALTVAPIGDGFKEYEMTLNAVQTTMAGTGKTAEEVEKELKKLDEYADKTVYSTADMLNNLPKFTNAGVALEDATKAMIGIANATALAGGDAGKASIAFYNLGQAIGTGYLTRMDYNSINNAGIATMEWKNAMVEAAIAQGTLTKVGEDAYQAGNKTLTLQQLFIDGLQEQWATTDVMMKVFGDYGDETTAIGEKAYSAAQDIKTFTMMMDSLKATAGTGWKDTWQIIFGGLDEAKEFWTGLTNFISNIITTLDDWRNNFLATALQSPFSKIAEKMKEIGNVASKVTEPVKDLSEIVNKVINGELGNTEERWGKLTEMGYDWVKVQNLVNEKLGSSYRRQESVNEATEEAVEVRKELNDALLEEIGLTEEEIEVYKKLQEISKKTGVPIEEINGRLLLIESFKNIGQSLVGVFTQLKNAWTDTFSPLRPVQLLNLIDKFHQFTEALKVNHEQSYKLYRTFKGLFAIIDIVATIAGGAFRIAFQIAKELLSYFNLDILDLTAAIGDVAVRFRNWIDSLIDVEGIVQVIGPLIYMAATAVREWISSIKESKVFTAFTNRVTKLKTAIKDWFAGLKNAENPLQYIAEGIGTAIGNIMKSIGGFISKLRDFVTGGFKDIPGFMTDGFISGLWDGIKKVGKTMLEFGKTIIDRVKEVLGIHSPSKVFFAIAGFVISGFVLGLRDKIGTVWPALGEFANGVVNFIKNIPFGKIFATAGSVAVLAFAASISKAFVSVAGVLDGVGDILQNAADVVKIFGKTVNRLGKAVSNSLNAMAFKQLAISIAILVGSIVVLTLLDTGKLWNAVGVIAALAGIMGALFFVVNKLAVSKNPLADKATVIDFGKMALGLFAIAGAIMIMAIAAKTIGDMDEAAFDRASTGIITLAGVMVGLLAATKLMAKTKAGNLTKDVLTVGKMLASMAVAILIMVVAAKLIAGMSWGEMTKAGVGLTVLAGIIVGLIAATKLIAKTEKGNISTGLEHIGKMLTSIAGAILILVVAAKLIAGMSWDDMLKAGVGLTVLAGLLVGLVAATQLIAKSAKGNVSSQLASIGKMLLSMALAIAVLVVAAKIIAGMEWSEMGKAAVGLVVLGGLIAGLVAATKLAGGNDLKGVASTLLAMSLAMGAMVVAVLVLSLLDAGALAKGVLAVAVLGTIMAGMVAATKNAKEVKGTMIAMSVAIAVMAASLAVLSFIDPGSLAGATAAMGAVMGMFALMTSQASKAEKAMAGLIVLVGAVAIIAGAIILLAELTNANEAVAAAGAISLVVISLSAALKIIDTTMKPSTIKNAALGMAGMLILMVPLMALIAILHFMPDVSTGLKAMPGIISAMTALTILLAATAGVGAIYSATAGLAMLGIVGLLAMMVPLMALIAIIHFMPDVSVGMESIQKVVQLMAVMTVMLVALAIVGPLALVGITALNSLIKTMVVVGLLAAAVGLVADQVGPLLDKGIPLLVQLAEGLGQMIGSFMSGILVNLSAGLPEIGNNLSTFMDNVQGFISGAKQVDGAVLAGVGILAASVLALTAVDLISGIASFLQFGSSFASLGFELSAFMIGALPFINIAKTIDPSICESVKALADMMLILSAASLVESIASWISGGSSLVDFGMQLIPFGQCLKSFSDAVVGVSVEAVTAAAQAGKALAEMANIIPNQGGLAAYFAGENSLAAFAPQIMVFGWCLRDFSNSVSGINVEAVTAAAQAGKTLAEMASTIPNQGGLAAYFAGENSLAFFAPQIVVFGHCLKAFSDAVTGINTEAVTAAAQAGKTLAEMASTIPNQGGMVSWFAGENSLAAFGPQIAMFGLSMKSFSDNVSGINVEAVTAAAEAGKTLAQMTSTIPNQGGMVSWFAGENSLAVFGPQIASFGLYLKWFSDNVSGINVEAVTAAAEAGKNLAKMANTIPNQGGIKSWFSGDNSLAAFGPQIASFGLYLKWFSDNVAGVNPQNITAAAEAGKDLAQMASAIPSKVNLGGFGKQLVSFGKSMTSFADEVSSIESKSLDDLISAFKGTMEKIADIGTKGVDGFVNAFTNASDKVTKAGTTLAQAVLKGFKSKDLPSKFSTIGTQLVDGFAAGITASTWKAQAKSAAMANAALDAAKAVLRINSPSKAFRDIGMSVPEGFAMGIDKLSGMVKNSAVEMADGAIDGTRAAIARIADAVNSDIETQPTIRPVLDLSDVQAGANSLSGMFNMTPSVGVMANVGAISSMMNNRQNGGNDDVISALKDLKSSLSGRAGDTYTINGVTYDDGSNVSEAVKSLVRAARIERRV